jgi:hypothetical protein
MALTSLDTETGFPIGDLGACVQDPAKPGEGLAEILPCLGFEVRRFGMRRTESRTFDARMRASTPGAQP